MPIIDEFRNRPAVYSEVYASLIKYGKWKQFDFFLPKNLSRSLRSIYGLFADWNRKEEKKSDDAKKTKSDKKVKKTKSKKVKEKVSAKGRKSKE